MSRKKKESKWKGAFIYLNGRPFTMADLGPAADMNLADAMQYIVDSGLLHIYPKGTEWYKVLGENAIHVDGPPPADSELLTTLYRRFKHFENHCVDKIQNDTLVAEDKVELERLYTNYRVAVKLNKD